MRTRTIASAADVAVSECNLYASYFLNVYRRQDQTTDVSSEKGLGFEDGRRPKQRVKNT
jgi:hypothetical protein